MKSALTVFMRNVCENYIHNIIDVDPSKLCDNYWDIIVLTAADNFQAKYFESVIRLKKNNHALPIVPIHVFADDSPSIKIGTGGATLKALDKLHEMYGPEKLFGSNTKILMIHSGGYSQRLPSHTLTGKIFMPIPIAPIPGHPGSTTFDLFDLKLALFVPLIPLLFQKPTSDPSRAGKVSSAPGCGSGGILITCGDDIVTYQLPDGPIEVLGSGPYPNDLMGNGSHDGTPLSYDFVCLAHPSTMDIGHKHGVFVVKPRAEPQYGGWVRPFDTPSSLLRVLQKPDLETMRETGAIVSYDSPRNDPKSDINGCHEGVDSQHAPQNDVRQSATREMVYTDSSYVMGPSVMRILHYYYVHTLARNLEGGEIDAYTDFLQPLGQLASQNYPDFGQVGPRYQLYQLLKGRSTRVLALRRSTFYHMGTLTELLDNYVISSGSRTGPEPSLGRALGFTRFCNSVVRPRCASRDTPEFCVINSFVHGADMVEFGNGSLIEYCDIDLRVCEHPSNRLPCRLVLGPRTILSHCKIDVSSFATSPTTNAEDFFENDHLGSAVTTLEIPPETFWYTCPYGSGAYVTFAFHITDDYKKMALDHGRELTYMGRPLVQAPQNLHKTSSLWTAKLFEPQPTAQASFVHTYAQVRDTLFRGDGQIPLKSGCVSLEDVCSNKETSLPVMFDVRTSLLQKICDYHSKAHLIL